MNKIMSYWNKNRIKIIIVALIVAFIFILINVINGIVKEEKEKINNQVNIEKEEKPITSVLTGTTVAEEVTDTNIEVIEQFIKFLNEKKYNEAYNLLSEKCKTEVFKQDINNFIKDYCNNIFATQKSHNAELWIARNDVYTYKIIYYENNLLATGGMNKEKNFEDYITVEKENNINKLNINNFITKQEINKIQQEHNIEISIDSRNIYENYEKYNITIKNYTNKPIIINEGQNSKDICLIDKRDVQYTSMINEIPLNSLQLPAGHQRTLEIRFNKIYDTERVIKEVKFSNIILDADRFNQTSDSEKIEIRVRI